MKKPFTILVAVIAVLVLGVVSLSRVTMDLLPEMNLPYMLVITPYPGASPERVETEVTGPLEDALGTISHINNVYSVSSENYSMVQLEFEDGTDMDSAMVRVSSAINQVSETLPDSCGTSTMMEISMNMIATAYMAVEHDGYDIYQLSNYTSKTLIPELKRIEGVASVSDVGLVERTVQVELNDTKINELNDKILATTSEELDKALKKLEKAKAQVKAGQDELEAQKSAFGSMIGSAVGGMVEQPASDVSNSLKAQIDALRAQLAALENTDISASVTPPDVTIPDGTSEQMQAITAAQAEVTAAQQALVTAQAKVTAAQAAVTDAQKKYDDAVQALSDAGEDPDGSLQAAIDDAQAELTTANENLAAAQAEVAAAQAALDAANAKLQAAITAASGDYTPALPSAPVDPGAVTSSINSTLDNLYSLADQIPAIVSALESSVGALSQGQLDAAVAFATAANQLADAQKQLDEATDQYETARTAALKNANLDQLVSAQTLSGMIYAQNFSMPAGYIDDKDNNTWLLKIGDEFDSTDDLAQTLLCDIQGVGTVCLSDVADITIIDNSGKSYARLNGEPGVVLNVFKSSTSSTSTVSKELKKTIAAMQEEDPGLHIVSLMDQGDYIDLLVNDIFQSILIGALLAIVVLALFLKTVKPTLIVAISIPLSVLFAIVLMYFSNLSLNMMTLSGLALGIGMLVDNSIVVMENIFRLRLRGVPAPQAAVQGTKQVAGAICSSTLTTICIFFPMVFTTGTIRTLLVPLALSISYCLIASLIIAMTVVPASSSTILKDVAQKPDPVWQRIQKRYDKALRFCLSHKLPVLLVTVALLVICIIRLFFIGVIVLPDTETSYLTVTVTTPDDDTREESYATADSYMEALLSIDGVDDVGVIDSAASASLVSSFSSTEGTYGSYLYYLQVDEDFWKNKGDELKEEIQAKTDDLPGTAVIASSGMTDMSALTSSGLAINIYGSNLDTLTNISEDLMDIIKSVDGFEEVTNGSEENEQALHLVIDKDKAMKEGFPVAQLFSEINQRLKTSVTSTTVTINDMTMDVVICDKTNELNVENLLDMELTPASQDSVAAGSDMSAMMGSGSGDMSAMMDAFDEEESSENDDSASENDDASKNGDTSESNASEDGEKVYKLGDFAALEKIDSPASLSHENLTRYITVTAKPARGYNTALLSREVSAKLSDYDMPTGYSISTGGEASQVTDMIKQMLPLCAIAVVFIYLVMIAQFQSLLSPFIVMFTIPLAFTGGMIALILSGEPLSMLSLMGFLILSGTIVNNGIVFVDYANQLRQGGMSRRDALVATGMTRMRPIIMTAMTTILAMCKLLFGSGMGSQLGKGMAIVMTGGLIYATFMTLFIVPVLYDAFFKRPPLKVDIGSELDEELDDAAEFLALMENRKNTEPEAANINDTAIAADFKAITEAEITDKSDETDEDISDKTITSN